jgi:hypothetical protein
MQATELVPQTVQTHHKVLPSPQAIGKNALFKVHTNMLLPALSQLAR